MDTEQKIFTILRDKFGPDLKNFTIPPPVFKLMSGEFIDLDIEQGFLRTRFPIRTDYLNPYGSMQGGMIAAAIDNTIGPLSILVAPPNVTRRLALKYSLPIKPEIEFLYVEAKLIDQKEPRIFFDAHVLSIGGDIFAKAKAIHWIIG